jgi:translation initiation factor 4E
MSGKNAFSAGGNISTTSVASPTASGASSAFGLGSGAFASFGSASKTPKTPGSGTAFDFSKGMAEKKESTSDTSEKETTRRPPARKSLSSLRTNDAPVTSPKDLNTAWPLKYAWVIYYRPPTSKNSDYERSIRPMCRFDTAQDFWKVYHHLRRPSALPTVSDYHFFREGIRPVWEDDENKNGGKWIMRLKKGVADRYWEDLLLAFIGDQFAEAGEEVCGAVVSVRSGEDVFSIWTKKDGGRNVKIRETIKRVLSLPEGTNLQFRSHDDSIEQRNAVDQAREQKAQSYGDKRRNTLSAQHAGGKEDSV